MLITFQVPRRAVKSTPPPPVPRRAVAALSAGHKEEHSLSSSTSSLASNVSDRLGGSTEMNRGSADLHPIAGGCGFICTSVGVSSQLAVLFLLWLRRQYLCVLYPSGALHPQAEQPPPIPAKLSRRPARATETTDGQAPVKSYSIEDITAALDDEIKQNNVCVTPSLCIYVTQYKPVSSDVW